MSIPITLNGPDNGNNIELDIFVEEKNRRHISGGINPQLVNRRFDNVYKSLLEYLEISPQNKHNAVPLLASCFRYIVMIRFAADRGERSKC